MIKNVLKSLLFISLFFVLSIFGLDTKVHAEDINLPLNVQKNGTLTEDIVENNYSINVTEAGRISFDLTSYIDSSVAIALYDANNNEVFYKVVYSSSANSGKFIHWEDVEAGTYRLKIFDRDSWFASNTGSYQIKTNFTSANNNEIEPNNGTIEAQPLNFNQSINGFLSWDNNVDFYKINVPSSGTLNLDLSSYVDTRTYIALFDNNNNEVFSESVSGSSLNPSKLLKSVDVNKGTFYLKVYDGDYYDRNSGKYLLKSTFSPVSNNDVEPNNGVVEAQLLSYNKMITGFLTWDDTVDVYKINVTVPGKVGINFTTYVDSRTYIELLDSNNETLLDKYIAGSSKNPGKYNNSIELGTGTYYLKVFDGDYYDQNTGKYLLTITPPSNKHIGRVLIKTKDQYLYSPKGTKVRKLKQHEGLRIYKVLGDRYDVGSGYYVKKNKANLFYIGHIWSKDNRNLNVYTPNGYYYKSFKPGQPVRVYGYSNGYYDVGAGYKVATSDYVQFDR